MVNNPGTKLLQKFPDNLIFSDTDIFEVNPDYASVSKELIRVSASIKKETKDEIEEIEVKLANDRKHVIDAALVKIMKLNKVMIHGTLIESVTERLYQIPIDEVEIRKRVEALIRLEYIRRDPEDFNIYHYLP